MPVYSLSKSSTLYLHLLVLGVGLAFFGIAVPHHSVYAVTNNNAGMPDDPVLDLMSSWGQTTDPNGSSRRSCNSFNNAQFGWVSAEGETTVRSATLNSADAAELQFNTAGATCDSVIATNGKIQKGLGTELKITRSRVISAQLLTSSNSPIGSVSGIVNKFTDVDYNFAQFTNQRYTAIESLPFTVSGLGSLAPGTYPMKMRITYRPVNKFIADYKCVANGVKVSNIDGTSCPTVTDVFPVRIIVEPTYNASTCQPFTAGFGLPAARAGQNIALANTAGTISTNNQVQPGQEILLGVKYRNTGSSTWNGGFGVYALAKTGSQGITVSSAPAPYNNWSVNNASNPKLVYFQDPPGTVAPGGTVNFWFKVTLPSVMSGAPYTLSWRMRQTASYESRGVATFGQTCSVTVQVPNNRPFINIGGGDVISGARFFNEVTSACEATAKAKQAKIVTNGYYGKEDLRRLNGYSSAQYGVFASGDIGDSTVDSDNNFLGNYGYYRPELLSATNDARDALFAGISITDDTINYGHFYDDNLVNPPLPCVDVSAEKASAAANPTADVTTARTFVTSGNGSMRFNGNLSIPLTAISAGTRKTLVVNGDVTIEGNITYPANYTSVTVPYLKIIANNIYIRVAAQRVDANLVAYPNIATNGVLDTCSDMQWKDSSGLNIGATPGDWISANKVTTGSCKRNPNSFVVNGAVAARRILWKRTNGTLAGKDAAADSTCYYGNYDDNASVPKIVNADTAVQRSELCAAELIEFSPEAYLSGFSSGSQNLGSVPTSTQELPPIF